MTSFTLRAFLLQLSFFQQVSRPATMLASLAVTSFALPTLALISLSTLAIESAGAYPATSAADDRKNALQEQINKSNTSNISNSKQDVVQTDYSRNFSYIMPPGWQVTQNPLYPHDILVKNRSEGKGNIVLADQQAKGNLSKSSTEMLDELPKQCDEFKLVSNEMLKLSSKVNCARLIHTGKLGESEICQVNYLMPYTRGRILVITGTVLKDDKEGLDIVEKFASSVSMKKKK